MKKLFSALAAIKANPAPTPKAAAKKKKANSDEESDASDDEEFGLNKKAASKTNKTAPKKKFDCDDGEDDFAASIALEEAEEIAPREAQTPHRAAAAKATNYVITDSDDEDEEEETEEEEEFSRGVMFLRGEARRRCIATKYFLECVGHLRGFPCTWVFYALVSPHSNVVEVRLQTTKCVHPSPRANSGHLSYQGPLPSGCKGDRGQRVECHGLLECIHSPHGWATKVD